MMRTDAKPVERYVLVGTVSAFPGARPDKAQALKPLEEAAEVFGAWQAWKAGASNPGAIIDEIADCMQALANLAASVWCVNLVPAMRQCEARNIARGRYGEVFE